MRDPSTGSSSRSCTHALPREGRPGWHSAAAAGTPGPRQAATSRAAGLWPHLPTAANTSSERSLSRCFWGREGPPISPLLGLASDDFCFKTVMPHAGIRTVSPSPNIPQSSGGVQSLLKPLSEGQACSHSSGHCCPHPCLQPHQLSHLMETTQIFVLVHWRACSSDRRSSPEKRHTLQRK